MNQNIATLEASLAEAQKVAADAGGTDQNLNSAVEAAEKALTQAKADPSQDPVKRELEKVKERKTFTRKERLEFEKKKIDEQLNELEPKIVDNDALVTVGMLEQREKNKQRETALDLAEQIEDEAERELVKHQLESVITGGTPEERIKVARGYVNSLRNAQIAEEVARSKNAKSGNQPGAPARKDIAFEPTPEEAVFMQPPYNLTKEEVIAKRPTS